MSSRQNSGFSAKQRVEFARARRLGLKPYGKFKESLLPELKRVPSTERKSLLEKIYALAALKVRIEDDKKTEREVEDQIRPERLKLIQIRQHLQNAIKELSASDAIFPGDPWPWSDFAETIDELELRIANIKTFEILCADLIHPKLRSPSENDAAVFSAEKYPDFFVRFIKKESEIDFGFISALEQCLPIVGVRGGTIDAERTKIISKVFDAAFGKGEYPIHTVKSIRSRLLKKPLTNNPFQATQID